MVRFDHEKNNAKTILESKDHPVLEEMSFVCRPSGYDIFRKANPDVWLDTLPINDATSFFLDLLLLQELSSILLLDRGRQKQVCLTALCFILLKCSLPYNKYIPKKYSYNIVSADFYIALLTVNCQWNKSRFLLEMKYISLLGRNGGLFHFALWYCYKWLLGSYCGWIFYFMSFHVFHVLLLQALLL